ncbi:disease resistance-like protein DSC1 [Hevea brasiliensis]|uniref:disease resistance-like protein DSC1 n=1 Tax=Hevea brasiliensis TaxID=3981 RepID=UPI0025FBE447|nr:disease resistance-like protein DSC1 [Hevea brasiliensis]
MLHVLPTIVLDKLRRKKVFIVLDDVNDSEQLEALAGYHGWHGSGSRVIVTSRDKEVIVISGKVIVVNNKLEMHDLIQEMGQHIAWHEHSRLWEFTKICDILATKKVNKAVEGICLDTSKMGMTRLNSATFSQMPNLRLLKFFRHSNKKDSTPETFILESAKKNHLQNLPNKLSLLHWEEYPYCSLPLCFSMENLVLLNLEDRDVK